MFDFKDIALKAIHDIGGCDATEEWSRGYDAGVNAAYSKVSELQFENAELNINNAIWSQLKQIADHYGFSSQANMLTEEAAEFTVALNKLRRGNTDAYDNIKEEVADVLVIALQLRDLLGSKKIDQIIHEKIDRQLSRIREEDVWADEQLEKLNIKSEDFVNGFNKATQNNTAAYRREVK